VFVLEDVVTTLRDQATLLAMTQATKGPWHEVATLVEEARSAEGVLTGSSPLWDESSAELAAALRESVTPDRVDEWAKIIEDTLRAPGTRLVTVLDGEYPENLRKVFNHPPFLFVRGHLEDADARSVAVVGTRQASPEGLRRAYELARELASRGVTVISGMAKGIDTSAHSGALDSGGRTIAVMGTGIDRVYPAGNKDLAQRIPSSGALVSQFWPGAPPRSSNFPLRNVVTSGIAVGTVVIEANATSGAKMQARLALEHGKRVLLMNDLVMHEEWAQRYSQRRGAEVVASVEDILAVLDQERALPTALQLF
jgi:DNA processing protein